MTVVDRAAEIIRDLYGDAVGVEALADERLLVTDEIQAVLDAAIAHIVWGFGDDLRPAVDAYVATLEGARIDAPDAGE